MDATEEDTPATNGIFQNKNGLCCQLCSTDVDFFNWRKHIKEPRHVAVLERFNMIFRARGKIIECKVCEKSYEWKDLGVHAMVHELTPWYDIPDRHKSFFENHVIEWESQFYCYPCDKFFPEWSTALSHTHDEKHKVLVKNEVPINDLSSWNAQDVPYELLVNEGFVTWATKSFKCMICNRLKIALQHVAEHSQSATHKKLKVGFIREMKDWQRIKTISSLYETEIQEKKSQSSDDNSKQNSVNYSSDRYLSFRIYIVQHEGRNYCKICDVELEDLAIIDDHITGIQHLATLKKYGCDKIFFSEINRDYHCEYCNCRLVGVQKVFLHVISTKHLSKLPDLDVSTEHKKLQSMLGTFHKEDVNEQVVYEPAPLPKDHIIKVDDCIVCNICNWTVAPNSTDDHFTGVRHEKSIKQFHANITSCGNSYHCKCCDCKISAKNLYVHLFSNQHQNSIKKLETLQKISDENEARIREMKISGIIENHIVKAENNNFSCKICDCEISRMEVESHVEEKDHVVAIEKFRNSVSLTKGDKYHCNDCDCSIRGLDNVYLHIHGTKHCTNGLKENNSPANEEIKETTEDKKKSSNSMKNNNEIIEKNGNTEVDNNVNMPEDDGIKDDVDSSTNHSTLLDENAKEKNGSSEITEKVPIEEEISPAIKDSSDTSANTKSTVNSREERIVRKTVSSDDGSEGKRCSTQKKTRTDRDLLFVDLDIDDIYSMREKLKEIAFDMNFCFLDNSPFIYCMICHRVVGENIEKYVNHLWTLEHYECFHGIENDHDLFALVPGQFSELDLALRYMEEISEESVFCRVCNMKVVNVGQSIEQHIENPDHEKKCKKIRSRSKVHFDNIKSKICCDWYKITDYSCAICCENFETESAFLTHLTSIGHANPAKKSEKNGRKLIYDFCEKCALLWCGFRYTHGNHCETEKHKVLAAIDCISGSKEFTKYRKSCLNLPGEFIRKRIHHYHQESLDERDEKIQKILESIEDEPDVDVHDKISTVMYCIFPPLYDLLLLLEEWLIMCDLSGPHEITINALYWCVIYFLQRESILPSMAAAISKERDQLNKDDSQPRKLSHAGIKDLITKFLTFYAHFDYQYDVACPVIGKNVKKRFFDEPQSLPPEMAAYKDFALNCNDQELFSNESPMCVQSPWSLEKNVTATVKKAVLNKFRSCCRRDSLLLAADQQ